MSVRGNLVCNALDAIFSIRYQRRQYHTLELEYSRRRAFARGSRFCNVLYFRLVLMCPSNRLLSRSSEFHNAAMTASIAPITLTTEPLATVAPRAAVELAAGTLAREVGSGSGPLKPEQLRL